jgi:hypothetical protein
MNDKCESVETVKRDLENKVNPKSMKDGLNMLSVAINTNNPGVLLSPIASGADEFEKRTGRKMTYSEMREMWG